MNAVRSIEFLAAGDGQHNLFRTLGPTLLISMAYIDLGKWLVAVDSGSRFGYDLVLLVLLFNFSAILCQYLSTCIGMVTGKNLAEVQTYWAISYCWNLCNSCQSPQPLPDISPVIADILEFSITSRIFIISYEVMKIIWHLSPVSIHYLWVDKGCVWLQSAGSPFHHFRILVSLLLNRFSSWSLETKKKGFLIKIWYHWNSYYFLRSYVVIC